jgi:hypothetical protein
MAVTVTLRGGPVIEVQGAVRVEAGVGFIPRPGATRDESAMAIVTYGQEDNVPAEFLYDEVVGYHVHADRRFG